MSKLLVNGNAKLDKSVLCFSIPPIKTCPNCSQCAKNCYATKSYRLYPSCKQAWDRNYEISKDSELFFETISQELSKTKKTMVRVHVSGDFYSVEYIDTWKRIAMAFPHINFWTYTKTRGLSQEYDSHLDALESLPNFNIVESMPMGCINFGSDEYISELKDRIETTTGENAYICPCGKDKTVVCGKDCNLCATQKYVLFKQH